MANACQQPTLVLACRAAKDNARIASKQPHAMKRPPFVAHLATTCSMAPTISTVNDIMSPSLV
ncbi:hypothetical protein ColLi_01477 [Colletotrichum liriopes]|uniref:Uncharacterized protein n=1 Tax=Colletotrichum liriopes TaxID=708192 RepID=A0AA37LN07_9PEZI|nr:hypothetical protein ColLi_01477 [Colletotrichum liriopes]